MCSLFSQQLTEQICLQLFDKEILLSFTFHDWQVQLSQASSTLLSRFPSRPCFSAQPTGSKLLKQADDVSKENFLPSLFSKLLLFAYLITKILEKCVYEY